jgi:aminopeptidase N
MTTALHDYFRLFSGRNAEFSDFVKTLAQAYHWSDKPIDMGEQFDFAAWADTWLKTSGINIIEPVVELANGAESTYGFIKQLNIT